MSILEVLKYVLVVVGIIAVAALILWGLVTLILNIVEPHDNNKTSEDVSKEKEIVYQPQKLISHEPVQQQNEPIVSEYVAEDESVSEIDEQKVLEEEAALNQGSLFGELSAEEEEFIRQKQQNIEERLAEKQVKQDEDEEIDLDNIFIDDVEDQDASDLKQAQTEQDEDDDDADLEELINRILDGEDHEEITSDEEPQDKQIEESTEVESVEESIEEQTEELVEETVEAQNEEETQEIAEELNEETQNDEQETLVETEEVSETQEALEEQEESEEEIDETSEEAEVIEEAEEVEEIEQAVEQSEENLEEAEENNEQNNELIEKIKQLEEMLASQKAEYEDRIKEVESEKQRILEESENNVEKSGTSLSLEEYEERLETLKERLKNNEKDLKPVKKEYIPLAKIKSRLEKDNVKLRRKEALVAKQKVVLYGVNNYVDIDEDKAKKLAEDLDLLEGLRLSVQHCEEVMKANEERFPILENSYNSLIETNTHIKEDIEECQRKIAEIKASESNDEE